MYDNKGCKFDCSGPIQGYSCDDSSPTVCSVICGDGISLESETCDDNDMNSQRGCNSSCTGPLNGWSCTTGTSTTASQCNPLYVCGDGIVDIANFEACDDGSNDGLYCDYFCIGP